jgi:O-antigen ligase
VLASFYIVGIVLAAAMAGWLATIGLLMILVIIGLSRTQGTAVKGALKKFVPVLILGILLVSLTIPRGTLEERIKRFVSIVTITGVHTQRTEEVRIPVWVAAKNMFLDHPILGVGLGSMFYEYHKYMVARVGVRGKEFTHHGFNMFVDIVTEMGILGIGAILWFLFAYARIVLKFLPLIEDPFLSNMLLACFAASVAAIIQMQTETGPFWANNFWVLVGLSLAIINVAKTGQLEMQRLSV